MKIALAGLMHESNTFSPVRTDRRAFEAGSLKAGDELLAEWKDAHHEMGGFIAGAARFAYEPVPLVMAWATPSGMVADEVLDEVVGHIVSELRRRGDVDGLLLALHGAMVAQSYPDADGEVLRRLRAAVGDRFPIVVTLDYHANVSEALVERATAVVIYKTYPHVDQRERGVQAARILVETIRGEIRPTTAIAKPPVIINLICQERPREPIRSIMADLAALENRPGVLAANLAAGFAYADVPQMGPALVIVTDGDAELARREADRLAERIWSLRAELDVR